MNDMCLLNIAFNNNNNKKQIKEKKKEKETFISKNTFRWLTSWKHFVFCLYFILGSNLYALSTQTIIRPQILLKLS
jgi:hypothetical protein